MIQILKPRNPNLNELARLQESVAKSVIVEDRFRRLKTIAGCDISFTIGNRACAACAVLDYKSLDVLNQKVVGVKLRFPYIPTFLAFRELEGMLKAVSGMDADVYMVGAQGLAHPRRAGLACHFGVALNKPTLGVAKKRLLGSAVEPSPERGAYSLLKDDGDVIGAVVRTQASVRPVYVSVGHKLSLNTAIRIALETTRERRMPEPLRVAHEIATLAMESG
jgi:deoxyribonuclease V